MKGDLLVKKICIKKMSNVFDNVKRLCREKYLHSVGK